MGDLVQSGNQDLLDGFNVKFNTKNHWEKIIGKINRKIAREGKIQATKTISVSIGNYTSGQMANPASGWYFGVPAGKIKLVIPLIIWEPTTVGIDNRIRQIYETWTDAIWNEWVEQTFGKSVIQGQTLFDPANWDQSKGGFKALGLRKQDVITRMGSDTTKRTQKAITAFKTGLKMEHSKDTTKAMFALEDIKAAGGSISDGGYTIEIADLVKWVESQIQVDWRQTQVKKGFANYHLDNFVDISLGPNPKLISDKGGIEKKALSYIQTDLQMQFFKDAGYSSIGEATTKGDPFSDPKFVASKTIARQVTDDIINDIIKSAIKAKTVKKLKQTATKFKPKPRQASLKKRTPYKTKRRIGSVVSKSGRPLKSRRGDTKGTGQGQENLIRLRSKIQRSLPAEIRRNMGTDGRLHNRTGRFSNSARLLNLRETAGGISGEYTYQKFPYQTFEPGFAQGKARWDPRKLITMSIRELALRHTEIRFTQLRRM
jgi:hypothetical protein